MTGKTQIGIGRDSSITSPDNVTHRLYKLADILHQLSEFANKLFDFTSDELDTWQPPGVSEEFPTQTDSH